jgi:hypothetical protein
MPIPAKRMLRRSLPGALLWGIGIGIAVTPLTAAVLAAVLDADLGEAWAINDASARVGGLLVVALVPALIGATGGKTLARALGGGFQPAMLVMAGDPAVDDRPRGEPDLRGHGKANVVTARKLAILFWCMLSRGQDYAHQRPALTKKKLRELELTAAPSPAPRPPRGSGQQIARSATPNAHSLSRPRSPTSGWSPTNKPEPRQRMGASATPERA